ncbi:MAG: hypothetical protein KatS3mg054_0521 [Chloroflexus sp.]|uniref:hypothetical protein n=1 Tax=Chloroflexus sp. TaxID=1904827 RepID=UPI0021DF245C|nr:MAG: hypothetical protein KatS3mg054_0521 [Chloroflexus sp.]GIV92168.1 MAG: hypothetical protein KatS3mg056_0877 [Chloroflexus sp.]
MPDRLDDRHEHIQPPRDQMVYGMQRARRAHDPARVASLTRLVTRIPGVLVTIMELVGNE